MPLGQLSIWFTFCLRTDSSCHPFMAASSPPSTYFSRSRLLGREDATPSPLFSRSGTGSVTDLDGGVLAPCASSSPLTGRGVVNFGNALNAGNSTLLELWFAGKQEDKDVVDGGRRVPPLRTVSTAVWQACQFPPESSPTAPNTGFTVRPQASYSSDWNSAAKAKTRNTGYAIGLGSVMKFDNSARETMV